MATDQIQLGISLIGRQEEDSKRGLVDAIVTAAWMLGRVRYLSIITPNYLGGLAMLDISLDNWIIRSITLKDKEYPDGYVENYSAMEYDQIMAFENLKDIFEGSNVVSSIKVGNEELSNLNGPKRIEITLRKHNQMSTERHFVVTLVIPPQGHYTQYAVRGREWSGAKRSLSKVEGTVWDTTHWIRRVDTYVGGQNGSTTDHFSATNQEKAWGYVEGMINKFQPAELTVIKNWTPDNDIVSVESSGYDAGRYGNASHAQHWSNKLPAAYASKEAHFRVAGDEVGALIHQEQQRNWEREGRPSPDKFLKETLEVQAEKKAEAGDQDKNSDTSSGVSDYHCSECKGTECPTSYCLEEEFEFGMAGVVIDGRYQIH